MKKEEHKKEENLLAAGGPGSGRVGIAKKDYSVHDQVDGKYMHYFIKKGEEVSDEKIPKRYWDLLKRESVL